MHSWSLALLWGKLLSSGPNRDKSPLVSGSRMENKVCGNTSLPTRNFYPQSRAKQGRAGLLGSQDSRLVSDKESRGFQGQWGGGGDDTSIWSGLFFLHLDAGDMSTTRFPVIWLHLLLAAERLPWWVKTALPKGCADLSSSQ